MYQGKAKEEIENDEPFLYDPKEIDFYAFNTCTHRSFRKNTKTI